MSDFLVELYMPQGIRGGAEDPADWGRSAAEEASSAGFHVRHLETILVPAEETCFFLYRATCAEEARRAAERTRLRVVRVDEALLGGGRLPRRPDARSGGQPAEGRT